MIGSSLLPLAAVLFWVCCLGAANEEVHDHEHEHEHHYIYPDVNSPLATYELPAKGGRLITDVQQACELESLNLGTRLADRYNNFDEATDWDVRIHHDYLTKYLGFAGWIQMGLWKNTGLTATRQQASAIHKVSFVFRYIPLNLRCKTVISLEVGLVTTTFRNQLIGRSITNGCI